MDFAVALFALLTVGVFSDLFIYRLNYEGLSEWLKNQEGPDLHGMNMTLNWMILPFLGQIATFHFNYKKNSGIYHSLAGFSTVLGTAATAVFLFLDGDLGKFESGSHAYGGVGIFASLTLLFVTGVYFKSDLMWGKADELETANKIKKVHIWIGYPTLAFSIWQVYTGVSMRWPKFLPVVYYWYSYILAVEIFLFFWPRIKNGQQVNRLPEIAANQVSGIYDYDTFKEVKQQRGGLLILYDNGIYDLKEYASNHPGGAAMLQEISFHADVGRYLEGNYGFTERIPPHLHSRESLQLLLPQYKVGDFVPKTCAMSDLKETFNDWVIVHKHSIDADSSIIYLQPKKGVKSSLKSLVDYAGKHVRVECKIRERTIVRYYTPVFCFTPERSQRRSVLCEWNDSEHPESSENAISTLDAGLNGSLPLCIKHYPFSDAEMSPFVNSLLPDQYQTNILRISKPLGVGLALNRESYGLHIALVAGTGVLPLLDLYDLILGGLTRSSSEKDESSLPKEFFSSFEIKTYAVFRSRQQAYGLNLMELCDQVCQNNGVKTANFHFFFRSRGQQLRPSIIKMNEEKFLEAKKIYVCGPPSFNDSMTSALLALGRKREEIFLI